MEINALQYDQRTIVLLKQIEMSPEGRMFKNNEGMLDRIVRVIIGLVILSLIFIYPDAGWRWWSLIGIVPLVTGLIGTCPIYSILGLSTCPIKKS